MLPIKKILAQIPDLTAEAWATWGTNPVSADGDKPHRMPGSIVLADLDRIQLFDETNEHDGLGVLSSWVQAITEEHDQAGEPITPPASDVVSECGWLTDQLDWCTGRGFETQLHDDLRRLHKTLKRVCRYGQTKPLECPTNGCTGHLGAVDGMLECQYGHRHDGLRKWRHHNSMPLPELSDQFGIPERTLRHWIGHGLLATDSRHHGKPRYCWPWDVLRIKYPELVGLIEDNESRKAS